VRRLLPALCLLLLGVAAGAQDSIRYYPAAPISSSSIRYFPTLAVGCGGLCDDLVSYWTLDEASGTRIDDVGDVDLAGVGVGAAAGKNASGAAFVSGDAKRLSATTLTLGTGDFALSLWVKQTTESLQFVTELGDWQQANVGSDGLTFSIYTPGVNAILRVALNDNHALETFDTPIGTFFLNGLHNLVLNVSGATWTLYLNGVSVGTGNCAARIADSLHQFSIGGAYWGGAGNFYLNGLVDEYATWRRSLTSAEITRLYNWGAGSFRPFVSVATFTAPGGAFFAYGDSKTAANAFQPTFQQSMAVAGYTLTLDSKGTNGIDAATLATQVDADMADASRNPYVGLVLYNIGSNDSVSLPAEATWKANTAYILDALHAKWPNAKVGVARPWRRGFGAACNTLATWISDLVTARSAWALLGPDERVFLENGDDGVTYTADGIHPNVAGYALTSARWKTTMGY
jgi:lysophospholipase L1-like esterase